jgi:diamine N-acetyltransferase
MTIYLRPIYIKDIDKIFNIKKNTSNWTFTKNTKNYINRTLEDEFNWFNGFRYETNTVRFSICLLDNNEVIGSTILSNIDYINKEAEFHIYIDEEYIGNGYGKESMKLILEYAKNIVKLKSIYLEVHKDNIIAQKLYKKMNFVLIDNKDLFYKFYLNF